MPPIARPTSVSSTLPINTTTRAAAHHQNETQTRSASLFSRALTAVTNRAVGFFSALGKLFTRERSHDLSHPLLASFVQLDNLHHLSASTSTSSLASSSGSWREKYGARLNALSEDLNSRRSPEMPTQRAITSGECTLPVGAMLHTADPSYLRPNEAVNGYVVTYGSIVALDHSHLGLDKNSDGPTHNSIPPPPDHLCSSSESESDLDDIESILADPDTVSLRSIDSNNSDTWWPFEANYTFDPKLGKFVKPDSGTAYPPGAVSYSAEEIELFTQALEELDNLSWGSGKSMVI